jgi:Na+-transporting NADH:ubiquinone oxidoreductase subunit NqrB
VEAVQICIVEYKKYIRKMPVCLECGNQIRYGRTDKKFCCDDCKTRHHNSRAKAARSFKSKVLALINRNYEILDALVKDGVDSVELMDLMTMGFVPGMMTSYRRSGKHDVFTCYDIKYIMTSTRVYSIMKIHNLSVNLQVVTEANDQ